MAALYECVSVVRESSAVRLTQVYYTIMIIMNIYTRTLYTSINVHTNMESELCVWTEETHQHHMWCVVGLHDLTLWTQMYIEVFDLIFGLQSKLNIFFLSFLHLNPSCTPSSTLPLLSFLLLPVSPLPHFPSPSSLLLPGPLPLLLFSLLTIPLFPFSPVFLCFPLSSFLYPHLSLSPLSLLSSPLFLSSLSSLSISSWRWRSLSPVWLLSSWLPRRLPRTTASFALIILSVNLSLFLSLPPSLSLPSPPSSLSPSFLLFFCFISSRWEGSDGCWLGYKTLWRAYMFLSLPSFSFLLYFCILHSLPLCPVTSDPMLDPPSPSQGERKAVFSL